MNEQATSGVDSTVHSEIISHSLSSKTYVFEDKMIKY